MTGADDITRAVRSAVAEGEAIVARTSADLGIEDTGDDAGPRTRAWKRGTRAPRPPAIDQRHDDSRPSLREMIARVVAFEAAGRPVVAALGLIVLHERFQAVADELPDGEQTWPAFARKHIPIEPQRIDALLGLMLHRGGSLRCSRCGVQSRCACACGAPYVTDRRSQPVAPAPAVPVSALDRAIAAIAADPEKSNRAIAAEIGVSPETVRRARPATGKCSKDVASDVAPPNLNSPGHRFLEAHSDNAGSAAADQLNGEAHKAPVGGGTKRKKGAS